MDLQLKGCVAVDKEGFESIHRDFQQIKNSTNSNYFLTWSWVSNWLLSLPNDLNVKFGVLYNNDLPVCAVFLTSINIIRKRVFNSRSIFVNSTGVSPFDNLCIEYNNFFYSTFKNEYLKSILDQLPMEWDEINMPSFAQNEFKKLTKNLEPYRVIIDKVESTYLVDLNSFDKSIDGYLSLLSSNTRSQIRRAYRGYEKIGKITTESASDLDTAIEIFNELIELHQNTWQSRGLPGAFDSDYFLNFHEKLIKDRFYSGEIQILRISAGKKTLACLYNFVCNEKVMFYQSGVNYKMNQKLKPGIIAQVETIVYNAKIGNKVYDFLVGDSQYKRSLSTVTDELIWGRIQKPLFKFRVEEFLKEKKRWLVNHTLWPFRTS